MLNDFDDKWNKIYDSGSQLNRYPYDEVVSFLFRNRDKTQTQTVLEVGCGAGNNLWFAAREGFEVYGFDASQSAIEYARKRFEKNSLHGSFEKKFFSEMNYSENFFDFVIDRSSLNCTQYPVIQEVVKKIYHSLKPNGLFYMNVFSQKHSSFSGAYFDKKNKYCTEIVNGTLTDVGGVCFFDSEMIDELFSKQSWKIEQVSEYILTERNSKEVQAMWMIHARK